jgi:hypothetical protein
MNNNLDQIGELIGKALASRQEPHSVNVHIPHVEVSVDPLPLAEAVNAGNQANVKAFSALGDLLTKAVSDAILEGSSLVPNADLTGIEHKMAMLVDVVSSLRNDALAKALAELSVAVAKNTEAVTNLVAETRAQNKILASPKTITYDQSGRVHKVEVA